MDIGIVTIAFNGYGRFLVPWCKSICELYSSVSTATVALGKNHGVTDEILREARETIYLDVIEAPDLETMGSLRNLAVEATDTEWIQYLSIDDIILPWAIEEYERYSNRSDFICISWQSEATWKNAGRLTHTPKTPIEVAKTHKGFINNQSPYRRWIWERNPYMNHNYPNAPFIAGAVELGARFSKTKRPCTVYLRRLDSHCGRNLGRRGSSKIPSEKKQAIYWKNDAKKRIIAYYKDR